MKMFVMNRKITLSILILMMIALLLRAYTSSYADIVSVKPGDDDTSLNVTFDFTYREDASGFASQTFRFQWRQKTPPGEWKSAEKRYTESWFIYLIPIRSYTLKKNYRIEGLLPGTTYEVRIDNGAIHEATTRYIPLSISAAPPLTEARIWMRVWSR